MRALFIILTKYDRVQRGKEEERRGKKRKEDLPRWTSHQGFFLERDEKFFLRDRDQPFSTYYTPTSAVFINVSGHAHKEDLPSGPATRPFHISLSHGSL